MEQIKNKLIRKLSKVASIEELKKIRVQFLGKKGYISKLNKVMNFQNMSEEECRKFGRNYNEIKNWAEKILDQTQIKLQEYINVKKGQFDLSVDLTLPGKCNDQLGSLHPITIILMELEQIFQGMSFIVGQSCHIENEYYNFDSLNIPSDHPAREMQDTFWLTNGMLMRTHTSANQVRMIQSHDVPLRVIFPGRCFRYEAVDASHENTFYQLEGLMVDKCITIAHLIGVMKSLLNQIFHRFVVVRFRPGFFPFVEPGFELDCQCLLCNGMGCKTCKQSGWIELLPCGMIHPRVLQAAGVDFEKWSGFAFGLGLTRLAMMKYNVPEIRLFNGGDIHFLEQFPALI